MRIWVPPENGSSATCAAIGTLLSTARMASVGGVGVHVAERGRLVRVELRQEVGQAAEPGDLPLADLAGAQVPLVGGPVVRVEDAEDVRPGLDHLLALGHDVTPSSCRASFRERR